MGYQRQHLCFLGVVSADTENNNNPVPAGRRECYLESIQNA
ncbi:hypothetical protein SAMN03080615_00371 [Amphritea atlantica]|uniref:Uncharacterized protein n=1 Tax=Amphritea atlantica TaxID=355243 RepID=A0A1H9D8D3_9GAMM|nr:hypothetical protein SAMN03080615_00371 [Amphritea atlantica]